MFGTLNEEELSAYLVDLPDASFFSKEFSVEFQRIHLGHTLTYSMNMGDISTVNHVTPQITRWIEDHHRVIPARTQLAFLHNLAVAHFMMGQFEAAYQMQQRIFHHPARKVSRDIHEFAQLLQIILNFEQNRHDLNENWVRNAAIFVKKNTRQWKFEEAVIDFIKTASKSPATSLLKTERERLSLTLGTLLHDTSDGIPLLGLSEVSIWINSKSRGISIYEAFLHQIKDLHQ